MFSPLTGESMILKLALTIILLYLCCFGILQRFFCVKLIFVSSLHEGSSISSKKYLLLALPHLWLTVLKLFRTKVHFFPDQNMEYNGVFSCASTKPVPQSVMSQRGSPKYMLFSQPLFLCFVLPFIV
jgi:hypothetical protein